MSDPERSTLAGHVERGLVRLRLDATAPPGDIVRAVDALIEAEQVEREKALKGLYLLLFKSPTALIAEAAAVWGEQVVRELSWTWQKVVRKDTPVRAIVAPQRTHVVFPDHYVSRMVEPPYDDNTLMLTFNLLEAGNLPAAAPGAMEDITGSARHIVPKRVRPVYRRG